MIAVSRAQYDQLIDRYPAFMATDWPKLRREWHVWGSWVFEDNCPGLLHALRCNLATLPRLIRV